MAAGESGLCFVHDPAKAEERAEARRRGGLNRQTPNAGTGTVLHLRDLDAVQGLLENVVADTLLQENSSQRSRTLGYLTGFLLRILESRDLEERVEALEKRLRQQDLKLFALTGQRH